MRLGTSFNKKYILSVQSHRDSFEKRFNVRIIIDINTNGEKIGSIDIYGNDEERVVQCFVHYVNDLFYAFKQNTNSKFISFPDSINTCATLLTHEQSYNMNISWTIS